MLSLPHSLNSTRNSDTPSFSFLSPLGFGSEDSSCSSGKEIIQEMKIHCNVCDTAEATVLCCADEAALCHECDEKVHAANKLASKHQRVSLSHSSSQMPKCDICQDTVGYFFCLEDRALLCRKCDVAIHTANSYVAAHQRFLLTGVKVGLDPTEPGSSSTGGKTPSGEKASNTKINAATKSSAPTSVTSQHDRMSLVQSGVGASMRSKRSMPMSMASEYVKGQPVQSGALEDFMQPRMIFSGGSAAGTIPQWPMDDFLGLIDSNQNYNFLDLGTSKTNSGKLGESESSSLLQCIEDELDSDDQLGQVPDVSWRVPQVLSPPTASGLCWPKVSQQVADSTVFVPDICWSMAPSSNQHTPNRDASKRRWQF